MGDQEYNQLQLFGQHLKLTETAADASTNTDADTGHTAAQCMKDLCDELETEQLARSCQQCEDLQIEPAKGRDKLQSAEAASQQLTVQVNEACNAADAMEWSTGDCEQEKVKPIAELVEAARQLAVVRQPPGTSSNAAHDETESSLRFVEAECRLRPHSAP